MIVVIIIIILLIVAGVFVYINFLKPKPIVTTKPPTINPIPKFYLRKGNYDWVNMIKDNSDIQIENFIENNENQNNENQNNENQNNENPDDENQYDENKNKIDNFKKDLIEWDGQMENIIYPIESDENKLASQFRFFAEFWLNKLDVNSGYTNVYDAVGLIGKYEFSKNKNIYTAKFNNVSWNWNTINYCFNSINSKRENNCLGGWIYYKEKCYPPPASESPCVNYDWNTMRNYTKLSEFTKWMNNCNVVDTPDCIYPKK
jgi:hypothetical protein